jgi:hypothetical protein
MNTVFDRSMAAKHGEALGIGIASRLQQLFPFLAFAPSFY